MALDLDFLKQQGEELENRGGNLKVFNVRKLKAETDIRIMPPTERMGKLYYFEKITHWINGHPWISPATFGEPCPISEVVEKIKEGSDSSLKALVGKDSKYRRKSTFLMPALVFSEIKTDSKGGITEFTLMNDGPILVEVPISVIKDINVIVTSRAYQNASGMSILDITEGRNLIFSKKGSGLDTEYMVIASANAQPMDPELYKETPCPVDLIEEDMKSNDELLEAINVYLYGSSGAASAPVDKPKRTFKAAGAQ